MIGKLNVWRAEHRKDGHPEKMRVGGLVSIEELNGGAKNEKPAPIKSPKKKSPKLTLGRRSIALTKSHPRDTGLRSASAIHTSPPLHDESIFSNFPASTSRRPSAASENPPLPQSPPPRPKTADPMRRRRSKTAPVETIPTSPPWADKPLPLAIDMDAKVRSPKGSLDSTYDGQVAIATAIARPRTASGPEIALQARTRSETGPSGIIPRRKYSLTPSITPNPESRPESKGSIAKSPSNASSAAGSRLQRHGSQASRETTPPKPAAVRSSILDEVEGTLSATITELQELQGVWHANVPVVSPEFIVPQEEPWSVTSNASTAAAFPSRSSSRKYRPLPDSHYPPMPQSAREPSHGQHSYDPPGIVSQSLPPTPLNATTFTSEPHHVDPRLQSIQKAHEEQRQQIHVLSAEKEHVQRQLAFFRSKLKEFDSEKASNLRAAKEAEENLQITLNRLREAKVGETAAQNEFQSARNEISILVARCEEGKSKVASLNVELEEERVKSGGLQAKLEEVNTQKVDLLERELELRMEVVVTKKKLKKAANELGDVKRKQNKAGLAENETEKKLEEMQKRNQTLEEQLKQLSPQSDLPSVVADMAFRLEDLQRQMKEKDGELEKTKAQNEEANLLVENMRTQREETSQSISTLTLEKENLSSKIQTLELATAREFPSPATEIASLQTKLDKLQSNLTTARAEREQFSNLLLAEVRRTAVDVHERDHPALPSLKKKLDLDEAVELVRKRAKTWLNDSTSPKATDADEQHDTPIDGGPVACGATGQGEEKQRIEALEKEIEYYLNDIVLYKLDVKGYKKDLRKARERIRELSDADELIGKGSVTSGSSSSARAEALGIAGAEDGFSDSGGSPSNMI